jgi:ketosteroid isomerase-like protein
MTLQDQVEHLSRRVQTLEDEAVIRRFMTEMMQAADDRDNPQWGQRMASFYADDGLWTSGSGFSDVGMQTRGRAGLVKKFTAGTRIRESSHLLGSESISVDGDLAQGAWLCFEPVTLEATDGGEEAAWIMGRYTCEFKRVQNEWKVRTVKYDGIFCTSYDKGWVAERFKSIRPIEAKNENFR